MTDAYLLEQAVNLGIEPDFVDVDGKYHQASDAVLQTLIALLQDFPKSIADYDGVYVIPPNSPLSLKLSLPCSSIQSMDLLDEAGVAQTLTFNTLDNTVELPALAMGYYHLKLQPNDARFFLIVAPDTVYETDKLAAGFRQKGITLQLYSLRSDTNWGVGDFSDLADFMIFAGNNNLDFVGINPLHALFTAHPEWASPYSPSSRIWLNPIYLDVTAIPAFRLSKAAQDWWQDAETQLHVNVLRNAKTIDYPSVWQLKLTALRFAFDEFLHGKHSVVLAENRAEFARFCADKGESLLGYALFEALDVHFASVVNDGVVVKTGWLAWPQAYQSYDSAEVRRFANQHEQEIRFYQWLQWLCAVQLESVQQAAIENGVSMGLYGDLAVGVARGGADTWYRPESFCLSVSIGAPPDPLGPAGQNWQLPPLHPMVMQKNGFQDFIEIIRENMRLYGVLRIDHVMAMARLWWIVSGQTAADGAYVRYPSDALMAILALESHRHCCTLIGEDLGIVPENMRALLRQYRIYSYSVLYFTQQDGRFLLPNDYPEQAITVTSTHDLAPFSGYWVFNDLYMMRHLGIFANDAELVVALKQRERDKFALFWALKQAGCLPLNMPLPDEVTPELRRAVHAFGAMSAGKLYAMQIENLLPLVDNFNYPGVSVGYPNWACRLPMSIALFKQQPELCQLLTFIDEVRMKTQNSSLPYGNIDAAEQATIDAFMKATHANPFAYLGRHEVNGRTVVRTIQPDAVSVMVVARDCGVVIAQAECLDERGFFAAVLPNGEKDYQFAIRYQDNADAPVYIREDAYRFPSYLGELDAWLLGEGNHLRPYEKLGAHFAEIDGVRGVNFAVWAPNAQRVSVVGEFNHWDGRTHVMRRLADIGVWEIFIPDVARNSLYKFEIVDVNGNVRLKFDPYAFGAELRPGTASVVRGLPDIVPTDARRAKANHADQPISIYEVHLGSWRRRVENNYWLTYEDLAQELVDYVQDMGFTHIELMPLSEYPFDGSWGYQATGLYAPTCRFGSPEALKTLIAAAHRVGINVILDWVVGHFPTDEHGLREFDGTALYEHADPREGYHQDWNTLIYNFGRTEVENYLRGNALYWLERFGFDGLRVDAVASMIYRDYSRAEGQWIPNQYGGRENIEAIEFLRRTNTMLKQEVPGATEIAEESTSFPGVTHQEGLNFQYKWNMGWMNDTLRYMKEDPINRKYHHHLMTFGMVYQYSENFILPISHDEVVHGKGSLLNKMPGDCWQKFANLRSYYGYMWGYPGKKLLFMGNEFAQGREWNYQEPLDWFLLNEEYGGWHRGVQNWVRDLNHIYQKTPALYQQDQHPNGFEWLVVDDGDNSVFVFERKDTDGGSVIVISNFTPVVRNDYRFGVNQAGKYRVLLNSDDEQYRGSGVSVDDLYSEEIASHGKAYSLCFTIPPLATVYLQKV